MNNKRLQVGRGRRLLLWLLPPLSLVLVGMACSASGSGRPPPVTHLPAAQLRLMIRITGQYGDASTVQTQIDIVDAHSGQVFSLADKARLTCNGGDVKPNYPNNVIRTCLRQPPGGAYNFTFTDEYGATTTVVVPVPNGQFAILSPRDGSTVHIPRDGALAVHFTLPIPPPHSSITQFYVTALCQSTPSATCYSVGNSYIVEPTPTPLVGVPTATAFPATFPPTPTPSSSNPTATAYENRGPPTPTPPPGSTPTVPYYDGTVTQTGGSGAVALVGDFTQYRPGTGSIVLSITEQIAPDPGAFASVSVRMDGNTTANITWAR
jgi:hypothetical protein